MIQAKTPSKVHFLLCFWMLPVFLKSIFSMDVY